MSKFEGGTLYLHVGPAGSGKTIVLINDILEYMKSSTESVLRDSTIPIFSSEVYKTDFFGFFSSAIANLMTEEERHDFIENTMPKLQFFGNDSYFGYQVLNYFMMERPMPFNHITEEIEKIMGYRKVTAIAIDDITHLIPMKDHAFRDMGIVIKMLQNYAESLGIPIFASMQIARGFADVEGYVNKIANMIDNDKVVISEITR